MRLAISDQHEGLKAAIARVLGCPWQRCTVHFVRNMSCTAAAISAAWSPPRCARSSTPRAPSRLSSASPACSSASRGWRRRSRAARGRRGGPDRLLRLPARHWTKLRSTNPLERVNKEIGRRTDVVGIFPNDQAVIRLAGALLIEQNDEWLVSRRYLSAESIALVLTEPSDPASRPRRSHVLQRDPHRDRRPRRSSLRLALRARLRENQRGKPNREVTALPEA